MRIFLFIGALAIVLLAAVAALNWPWLATPAPMNIGFVTVQAPIGSILSSLSAVVVVALVIYLVAQSVSMARAARLQAKAIEAQRLLAEQAEGSRFNELRLALASEFERFSATLSTTQAALRTEIQDSGNSIAAMLAEIDDRTKPSAYRSVREP